MIQRPETLGLEAIAIVSAYNEADTVSEVLRGAFEASSIGAVVLINDGSTDATLIRAQQCADTHPDVGVKPFAIYSCPENHGKTSAMRLGAAIAKELGGSALRVLAFLDADASPLSSRQTPENQRLGRALASKFRREPHKRASDFEPEFGAVLAGHIDALVQPVLAGEQVMNIGLFHRNAWIDALKMKLNWGACGGTRAIAVDLWDTMLDEYDTRGIDIKGWQIEAALNTYTRKRSGPDGVKLNRQVGKVLMSGVVNVGSRQKAGGVAAGLARMARIHTSTTLGFAKFSRKL